MAFCKEFNAATKDQAGMIIPVVITVFAGQIIYFHHQVAAGLGSCSRRRPASPPARRCRTRKRSAKSRAKQVLEIVKLKMKDLNATSEEAAFRVIAGTARSMGIEVQE